MLKEPKTKRHQRAFKKGSSQSPARSECERARKEEVERGQKEEKPIATDDVSCFKSANRRVAPKEDRLQEFKKK
jgi:hypothetical protein